MMMVSSVPIFINQKTGQRVIAYSLFIRGKNKGKNIYYCSLRDRKGELIKRHFSTQTTSRKEAEIWTVKNYDRLLEAYNSSIENGKGKNTNELITALKEYFKANSKWLELDKNKGIERREQSNFDYDSIVHNYIIPFLTENNLFSFSSLTTEKIRLLQKYYNEKKISKIVINQMTFIINLLYENLLDEGLVESNPCNGVKRLKQKRPEEKGIFSKEQVREIFKQDWNEENERLINVLSISTGMRASEVRLLKVDNIIEENGFYYVDVVNSREDGSGTKTKSGLRKVPLLKKVYDLLMAYIEKNERKDFIFLSSNGKTFSKTKISDLVFEAGGKIKMTKEEMQEKRITFHSWRHFYSTALYESNLLSSEIIEYLMGHKTKGVKGIYLHLKKTNEEVNEKVLSVVEDYLVF